MCVKTHVVGSDAPPLGGFVRKGKRVRFTSVCDVSDQRLDAVLNVSGACGPTRV